MSVLDNPDRLDHGVLRFLTAGSVDDGKSTLIGRLLYDTKAILADQLAAIERTSQRRGQALDLSLLTDGLVAEREQGITIDVAYRYFATALRKFIIADAPGHEQYTRNMVTAASTAQLAILLVDARHGVVTQTRRHATLAHLLGIPHLVVAVNKMDLVGWRQDVFDAIVADFRGFAARTGIGDVRFVPISALEGDMVVDRGERFAWYDGPTLLSILETAEAPATLAPEPLRLPVQYVARPTATEPRGYMGRIESGSVAVGDRVAVLPSGQATTIRAIRTFEGDVPAAGLHAAVTLVLAEELDVSRGDMLAAAEAPFIGLPFVVRTVQPVLEELPRELEEAAATLGASRWQSFRRIVFPIVTPALLTGFALAFARAIGEYGSVIFIAGNMPMVSEIAPLLIITKLEQYDYTGATAIATVLLIASFALLLSINLLQAWTRRRQGALR